MYDNYNIKPLMGTVNKKGCNCQKEEPKKTCSYNKIDLKPDCGQHHFVVENYFSELVHDWEKEAARYNLGILELESIKYYTVNEDNGEILNKVEFTYRQGHEYKVLTFNVAPKGDKGDPGEPGKNGYSAFEIANYVQRIKNEPEYSNESDWISSLRGMPANINQVIVLYNEECTPSGTCERNDEVNNTYTLTLRLNKPELDISSTIESIISTLQLYYYSKSETYSKDDVNDIITTITNRLDAIEQTLGSLTLEYGQ